MKKAYNFRLHTYTKSKKKFKNRNILKKACRKTNTPDRKLKGNNQCSKWNIKFINNTFSAVNLK